MRAVLVVGVVAACANGSTTGDDAAAPADSGNSADVTKLPLGDASADATVDVFDAGCTDAALGGVALPSGTTATATTAYAPTTAAMAIDGDVNTYWNAGDFTGSITVMFPSPTTVDGVKLYVSALPTTSETYAISGIKDDVTSPLAQSTQTANQGGGALQTIAIPSALYDGIRIDVQGNQSWVAINEIAFATTYCP